MKIKALKKILYAKLLKSINILMNVLACLGIILIGELHFVVPFFSFLALFDFCFCFGYPLFLRYILKKKWFDCTKDDYLEIKYILFPWLIMEVLVMLYYRVEFLSVLQNFMNDA